jgi:FkbM family methyltransferase
VKKDMVRWPHVLYTARSATPMPTMTSTKAMWRRYASGLVIKAARKVFANTPIQKMSLTTKVYTKVFRFGSTSDEVTTEFRGIQLTVPTKDITIVPGLVGGFYEKIELDVFERLAAASKTIIDVGANVGLYSCIAACRVPAFGKVVAFEPVPENLGYLRRNLADNECAARVVVEEKAVGESSGKIDIYLEEGSIGTHSAAVKNAPNSATSISAPLVSLDGYARVELRDPVDLLKVDVEGYEGAVLRGAREMLRKDKPTLLIEFVPDHLANCNFSVDEFVNTIFDIYDSVFMVNEPRATLNPCEKLDLLNTSRRGYKNVNLIAISKASQGHHYNVIQSVRAAGQKP